MADKLKLLKPIDFNSQTVTNLVIPSTSTITESQVNNLETDLGNKENSANKVTSWSSTTTDTNYPSEKLVKAECDNIREVAEGKCKTFIIDDTLEITESTNFNLYMYYQVDGTTRINNYQEFLTYLACGLATPTPDSLNKSTSGFAGQLDSFNGSDTGHYIIITIIDQTKFIIVPYNSGGWYGAFSKGDIFLVKQVNVPDRWYAGTSGFCKLETSKIDLGWSQIGTTTDPKPVVETAAESGETISFVTTGEKYIWNNKGTYSKPSGGIPSTDLAESYYLASNPSGYTSNTGTVTSVQVQAGTGLVSSTSTAQSETLNTTISIASTYKLPTTDEWAKVQTTDNLVTSWTATTTDTNYPSEKLVKTECDNIRNVASGKCKSFVIKHDKEEPTESTFSSSSIVDKDGNYLTTWEAFTTYIGFTPTSADYLNSAFNSQNDSISLFNSGSGRGYFLSGNGPYTAVRCCAGGTGTNDIKTGDVFYVIATNIPDRWYAGLSSGMAYKLETTKVDLGWSQIGTTTDPKPTTLSGYGITDAATIASPTFTGTVTAANKIAFTEESNPHIEMKSGTSTFYIQAYDGKIGLGPGWTNSTKWDTNGVATFVTTPNVNGTNIALTTDIPSITVNPSGTASSTLSKININGTIYSVGGSGSGDVSGPSSSTDNAIARFDSTTGKVIQNSGVTIDDSNNLKTSGTIGTTYLTFGANTISSGAELYINHTDGMYLKSGSTTFIYTSPASKMYYYSGGTQSSTTANDEVATVGKLPTFTVSGYTLIITDNNA